MANKILGKYPHLVFSIPCLLLLYFTGQFQMIAACGLYVLTVLSVKLKIDQLQKNDKRNKMLLYLFILIFTTCCSIVFEFTFVPLGPAGIMYIWMLTTQVIMALILALSRPMLTLAIIGGLSLGFALLT